MPRLTLNLNDDMIEVLERVAESANITVPTRNVRLAAAIQLLLDNWDASQPEPVEAPESVERRTRTSKVVDEALLATIVNPDIALDLKTRQQSTTPRAADGLVPWEYIVVGYGTLEFVSNAAGDNFPSHIEVIREVLTRTPEDQWESEQVRSVIARAIARVR